jgi:hypothetical protein
MPSFVFASWCPAVGDALALELKRLKGGPTGADSPSGASRFRTTSGGLSHPMSTGEDVFLKVGGGGLVAGTPTISSSGAPLWRPRQVAAHMRLTRRPPPPQFPEPRLPTQLLRSTDSFAKTPAGACMQDDP